MNADAMQDGSAVTSHANDCAEAWRRTGDGPVGDGREVDKTGGRAVVLYIYIYVLFCFFSG